MGPSAEILNISRIGWKLSLLYPISVFLLHKWFFLWSKKIDVELSPFNHDLVGQNDGAKPNFSKIVDFSLNKQFLLHKI